MQQQYALFSRIFLFFLLCCSSQAIAQLPDFTLTVNHTNETCTGGACLSFSVSGTQAGATVAYAVYELPDTTTPITTTSGGSYCGLTAGSYSVVATQSLGGQSSSQQQTVEILSTIQPLTYTLDSQTDGCGETGTITVSVTSGIGSLYEIFDGPVIVPPQTSNSFSNLPAGLYTIRVFNPCGQGVVQAYTLVLHPPELALQANPTSEILGCNLISVSQSISTESGYFAYPITVTYTVTIPGSGPQTFTTTVLSGDSDSIEVTQDLQLSTDQSYVYDVTVSDSCGNTATTSGNFIQANVAPIVTQSELTCDTVSYIVFFAVSATVTEAPDTYPFALEYDLPADINGNFPMDNLLPGHYVIIATDVCDVEHILTIDVVEPGPVAPIVSIQRGCAAGFASIYIRGSGGISFIELISAPAAYTTTLPQNLAANLDSTMALRLANLPSGNYVFHVIDNCGDEFTLPITIEGLVFTSNVEVVEHCGSFDLNIAYSDNNPAQLYLWLQKFNPVTNNWEHPMLGNPYVPGTAVSSATAIQLFNNSGILNINFAFTGLFRVITYRTMFSTNPLESACINVLKEFEFLGVPEIDDVYSFACNASSYEVIVEAHGIPNLLYRITSFNGGPFSMENGVSNVFSSLAPGTYNFQVEDGCGNIVNRIFEILEPYEFPISSAGACEGQTAQINVPYFSFLNYEWYHDNPANILSTSGTLEIPNVANADLGIYYVHIFSTNPQSCIDFTLDYNLSNITPLAQAGTDTAPVYCGSQGVFDLNTLLVGTFQAGGQWIETTTSGTLTANNWDTSTVVPGTYVFSYVVSSVCGPDDISTHSITINAAPENPVAFIEQDVCEEGDLQLLATTIVGATYSWSGPDGFVSTEQNPIIVNATSANSGTYTVQAFIGSCASQVSSIDITMGTLAEFTLAAACDNDRMMITATTSEETSGYTYFWTGPNNFSSSQNPADITGNATGLYSVTVTNAAGCSATFDQNVGVTLCRIPQGVSANDDGANDSFDLSGFGENLKVKIFNRYGMVVYEMNNYVDQWHGQCKDGTLLPSATYYYHIQGDSVSEKTGWVYLLRH
ncbi:MAG: gliding motility-associated C-terminal domain-containing protein [Flavobacterium sp.]|nr:MAG: gliding motility-associated C-terminal domain-containing protein [Flavobacterium sp.]